MSDAGSDLNKDHELVAMQELMNLWNIDPLGIPLARRRNIDRGERASLVGSELYSVESVTEYDESTTGLIVKPSTYGTLQSDTGVTLAWKDLSVYVKQKKPWYKKSAGHKPFKRVLNNVSGVVRPGSLVALMGASGAGKSTLMNALANRTPREVIVDGEILFNGFQATDKIANISGYVHQHDLFVGSITVSEHLQFMARLKMDRRLTAYDRKARVQELLKELSLTKAQNNRIGTPGREKCISGGERKRLAFASEIITDPPLLFCDEPTSGLDSFNAKKLVHMMKEMAARGKTILCTIHQPNSEVFAMFDRLLLLAEGRVAYMGTSKNAFEFFESLGHRCPPTFNPADFYIHTCAVLPGHEIRSRERIKRICDNFSVSDYARDIDITIQHQVNLARAHDDEQLMEEPFIAALPKKPGCLIQFYWLLWRCFLDSYRNPSVHVFRTLQKVVIGITIGMCYTGTTLNQAGIQNIAGALFMLVTENTFPSLYGVLNTFPEELPVFLREHRNSVYGVAPYYMSKMIALIPGFIFDPFIFTVITYLLMGLRLEMYHFFMTSLMLILVANVAASCGAMFSASFESISFIMLTLIPLDVVLFISGGLFINLSTMPPWITWIQYISWFMYGNEALTIIQWTGVTNITCELPPDFPCLETGEEVIENSAFVPSHLPLDYLFMVTLYVGFTFIGYLGIRRRAKKR